MSGFLRNVENGKEFFCKDGRVVRNLKELSQLIKELPLEIFFYHVNEEKNDFANWVKHAIGDLVLANRIKRTKDRLNMSRMVDKRIFELSMY